MSTLVAGLALGVVQDITAGPIAAQAEKSKEEAYKTVFENAAGFSEYSLDDKGQAEDLVGYLPVKLLDMHLQLLILKVTAETFSLQWVFRTMEH